MGLTVGPGRTHMFYTGVPEFPFGFGLSFTSWRLQWAGSNAAQEVLQWSHADANAAAAENEAAGTARSTAADVTVSVELSNTGARAGKQTVLLFWRPKTAALAINLQQKLVAYRGTTGDAIAPGDTQSVDFTVNPRTLGLFQPVFQESSKEGSKGAASAETPVVAAGDYELFATVGGSEEKVLTRTLRVGKADNERAHHGGVGGVEIVGKYCTADADCTSIGGGYCEKYKPAVEVYLCHGGTASNDYCVGDGDCNGDYCQNGATKTPVKAWLCH